jgi:CMP/dCMP kinase
MSGVYGLHHLDTGLIYRAVANAVLDAGHSPDNVREAIDAAIALNPRKFEEAALKAQVEVIAEVARTLRNVAV